MRNIFGTSSGDTSRIGTIVVRASESDDWQESEVKGFHMKTLFHDPYTDETTTLMRMDPGAFADSHAHEHVEQIYVIEGSLSDDEATYHAGDYLLRPPGADHTTWSEDGGLVLLVYTAPRGSEETHPSKA